MSSRMSRARFTRVFSPPESESNGCARIAAGMSRPLATRLRSCSMSYPPRRRKFSDRRSYSASSAGELSDAMRAVSSFMRASMS